MKMTQKMIYIRGSLRDYEENSNVDADCLPGSWVHAKQHGICVKRRSRCSDDFGQHDDPVKNYTMHDGGLPVVDKSEEQLKACELKPFQIAIDQGIDMIMSAHILYPQIDDSQACKERRDPLSDRL